MSLERINLYNPVQEQLNVLRDMRRYHQEMEDADTVASFNVQFADSLEVVESESVHVQSVQFHKVGKSRYDKKAMRRKGSPKRFRDRSRKCAHEGHVWKTYHRGMSGDFNVRGRKLEKTGRPQSVNVHKDIVPVPEQEPWYIGDYETREVCEGVTVTMEWPAPEPVYGDGTEPEPMSSKEANDYTLYCLKMVKYWVHKSEQAQAARYDGKLAGVLREELQDSMIDFYEHALI